MITIHDRNEIPAGFSNDDNDKYFIIASFVYPDYRGTYFAFPHMTNCRGWGFQWAGFYSGNQDELKLMTWMKSKCCDISEFITETFTEYGSYYNITMYVLESPGDVEKFISDHNIMNSDFVQEMKSKWIHERSVIGVRHRFNV